MFAKHIIPRYYPNPWRRFCDRWWLHWLDLRSLWCDIVDAKQRASQGWADGDTWDLMSYHAGVTLGLLKSFKERHHGYIGESPEEYNAQLDKAIDGWEAKLELLTSNTWANDYDKFAAPLKARWEEGNKVFTEIYDSLWI